MADLFGDELFNAIFWLRNHLHSLSEIKKVSKNEFENKRLVDELILNDRVKNQITASFKINLVALMSCLTIQNLSSKRNKFYKTIDKIKNICDEQVSYDGDTIAIVAECNSLINIYLNIPHFFARTKNLFDLNEQTNRNDADYSLYYRGHKDSKYGLLPSFFRGLSTSDKVIDCDFIRREYEKYGLVKQYRLISTENKIDEMYAYFQHSIGYSPFLDLTANFYIGSMFALSKKGINPNDYYSKDAALFVFLIKNDRNIFADDYFVRKTKICWHKDKIYLDYQIGNSFLFMLDYTCFDCDFKLLTKRSNDRMKYQQGAFLFPYKCHIIHNQMLMPFDKLFAVKYSIKPKEKDKFYKAICDNVERYKEEYLMDPYLFLSINYHR